MSDTIEIQGKTVEAAVSEALLRMGARRDEVEIKVLEEPKSGFMGFLGGRAAKVMVRKKRSRGRGGSGKDFRVEDDNYQAHNLSEGRGRGSRRRPSGGSQNKKNEGQETGRDEKNRNRRGSRGRGGRDRNQEAGGRKPAQDQQPDHREQPVKAENQDRPRGRSAGGRSRNERGRRPGGNQPEARADNRQDSRQGNRQDNRQESRSTKGRDSRPPRQERVRAESRPSRPSAPSGPEETPTAAPVTGGRNQRREAPAPVPAPAPEPVTNITPVEKKEETSVATPKKQKRSFGGLGSRLKEKKIAAKAADMEASTPKVSPAAVEPTVAAPVPETTIQPAASPASAPARDYSSNSRGPNRRTPSRHAGDYADEVILAGIKGTEYAKAVGEVTDEGLDEALTELTDGLLARAGFPCRCETHPGEYRQIKVTTDDASAGMLIGRHGQTIDAVEHLVERMASNAIDARARINLDINNYRQQREESLAERVREAAESIRESGRPVHLEPMSARERRLVHMEAAEIEGLRTFTMDRSGGKHVVIAMENEPSEPTESAGEQPDYSE